jgi:predicted dehydrogenase
MNHRTPPSRRSVLKGAAAFAAAAAMPAWYAEELLAQDAPAVPKSANDIPTYALIGCGGRGRSDARDAQKFGRIVAVCDVDKSHVEGAALELAQSQREADQKAGRTPARGGAAEVRRYTDFRKLLDAEKNLPIVINGTPDHWHTLVNLAVLHAGKDVYSEKPLTLTIDEGKRVVQAVRQTGRVLQTGTQQRSDPQFRMVCELVRNGRVGKLKTVTTIVPAGLRGGPFPAKPVPQNLDWDMWLGQAPKVEYVPERCHTTFRFWYDYSGGTITDWGAHHNDIALWGMGMDGNGPTSVDAKRLAEPIPGGYTTVPQYEIKYTWANGVEQTCKTTTADSIFGSLDRKQLAPGERHNGIVFEGDQGWIYVRRGFVEASDPELLKTPLPASAERLYASNDHMGNFFECVRTRKAPVAEAEIGHRSVSVCHLGAISTRLGRKLTWDPEKEQFAGDEEANRMVAREQRKPWTYDAVRAG